MGTTFERAVTQIPLCNPSRTSVLSGQQPSQTGVLDNSIFWYDRVDPADTLPAVLRDAGAYVAMFGKNPHSDPIAPEHQAILFDEFLFPPNEGNPGQVIHDGVFHTTPFKSGRYGGSADSLFDEQTAEAAIDFLENRAGDLTQPFFLSVGISKPHLDWWAPPEFFNRYDQAEIRAALKQSLQDGTIIPGNGEYFDVPPMIRPASVHKQMAADMDLWVDYIHAYLAAVSYADAKVGEVLDALEDDPALAKDTAILLWSDHGYHLGDKDRWEKFTHWREATEVPFIIVDPDASGGQTANQVVSLVDIFPTVLDLMGINAPAGLNLSGNSLRPIVKDVDVGWYDPDAGKGVALTTIYGSFSIRAQVPGKGDLRYTIYPDGTEELYNLTKDPGEHVNRLNYNTGAGLTPADNQLHTLMRGLMDDKLEDNHVLLSDGTHAVVGTGADELLVSTKGFGSNNMTGGAGDDTYVLYGIATVTEKAGGGFDSIVLLNPSIEATFKLPANVEAIQVQRNFTGNDGNNWIVAMGGGGTLKGGGGNDNIRASDGAYLVDGGAGNDRLFGEDRPDTLLGGVATICSPATTAATGCRAARASTRCAGIPATTRWPATRVPTGSKAAWATTCSTSMR
jgi:arylsulfatase A-like enzyme